MQVVSMFFVASFHSGFEQGIVCCFFCAWAHTSLWSSSGLSRECLGCFGDVLGRLLDASGTPWGGFWELRRRLGRLLGAPGASGTPLGASGAPQGGSWVLPEHLREALGSSRDALGSVLGCFWDVLGSILGLRESVGSGKDAKVKIIVLPKEFIGF